MNEIKQKIEKICIDSKKATENIANIDCSIKNKILNEAIKLIKKNQARIIKANQKDLRLAKENHLSASKIDRLTLDETKINGLINSIREIIKMPDPIGKILYQSSLENGLNIKRISTPIGVMLSIFEARPNVTSDIAALSIKSGNASILRCGSDCINSSRIISEIYREALENCEVSKNAVILVPEAERDYVIELLKMDNYIDVVIPSGSKSLIKAVTENTRIPIFKHLDGNCHTYFHEKCDFDKARKIIINAKMRRTSICGATESLLIDRKIAKRIIPLVVRDLTALGCEIRGCKDSQEIDKKIKKATEQDYYTEFLDKIISLKIVKDYEEAIKHISNYGSSHTEAIITEDKKVAKDFLQRVNSAIVMHNASTQFADGGEFGFGAEVGIATGKIHARGPVGLEQLTIYKYIVEADCAIRK